MLTEYRGVVIVCFCLPASFVFGLYFQLRDFVYRALLASPRQHDARVAGVQAEVRRWAAQPVAGSAEHLIAPKALRCRNYGPDAHCR